MSFSLCIFSKYFDFIVYCYLWPTISIWAKSP